MKQDDHISRGAKDARGKVDRYRPLQLQTKVTTTQPIAPIQTRMLFGLKASATSKVKPISAEEATLKSKAERWNSGLKTQNLAATRKSITVTQPLHSHAADLNEHLPVTAISQASIACRKKLKV